ncbi:hypothetical protein JW926_08865, partial [Candidatus Sumerlaeota bacterium]|nr:hypothetical protein [Candidatus Sumerlaeota bacterium]
MAKIFTMITGFMLIASLVLAANPCAVGPSGEFTTIAAAIDSWCPGGANAGATAPFVINIDPSVEYDEVLTLDSAKTTTPRGDIAGDLIVQSATPGIPVVVKLQYDARTGQSAGNCDGLWAYQEDHNVTFKDILFCPSVLGAPIDDDLIKCDENNITSATVDNAITFDSCLFTDIYTSGTSTAPAVKSKADLLAMTFPADMTAFTPAGSMGSGDALLKFWGDASPIMERQNLFVKDCVFFTKNGKCLEAVCAGSTETITIQDSLFAMGSESPVITARPVSAASQVNILGTREPCQGDLTQCAAVLCCYGDPLYVSGGASPPIGDVTIRNFLCDMPDTGNPSSTVRLINGGGEGKLVEECIFSIAGKPGSIVDYPMTKNSVYNRVTFHRPWTVAGAPDDLFYLGENADPYGIILTDCVISGAGISSFTGSSGLDAGGFHLYNCGIAHPWGADAITSTGAQCVLHDCVMTDPEYLSYNRKQETFLDTSKLHLALASSEGVGIGGGAHYRGPDASDPDPYHVYYPNIFDDFGDCEADIFKVASGRSNWGDPLDGYGPEPPSPDNDIYSVQDQVRGVAGNALWIHHPTGRFEAGTAYHFYPYHSWWLFGEPSELSFYYKLPTVFSAYPRLAIRIDPRRPPFTSTQGQ